MMMATRAPSSLSDVFDATFALHLHFCLSPLPPPSQSSEMANRRNYSTTSKSQSIHISSSSSARLRHAVHHGGVDVRPQVHQRLAQRVPDQLPLHRR